jgi:outer membrane protein assembly factor BamB
MHAFAIIRIVTPTAGTVLLPAIVAVVVILLVVAFKRRQWIQFCRQRPRMAAAMVAILASCAVAVVWLPSARARRCPGTRGATAQIARYDSDEVALTALEEVRTSSAPSAAGAKSPERGLASLPCVLGRDFRRVSCDGGPSPVKLRLLWRFRPEDTMFLATPAVRGRRVYVAGCQSDLGGYTGLLACVDFDTGAPLWQATELGDEPLRPFFSSPALSADGKLLVIGQGLHADSDCSLLCFDAMTGQRRWELRTTAHIESSPPIFRDVVFVGAGAIEGPDGWAVGDPGFVVAVRISDGQELWRHAVNDPESSPAVDENGIVYIGSGVNVQAVVALRSDSDGQLREKGLDRIAWRTSVTVPLTSAVSLCGDLVVAGGGNGDMVHSRANAEGLVVGLDRKTGAAHWQTRFDDAVLGPIACGDGTAFCTSRTGEVVALRLDDGRVRWRARVNGKTPVLAGCAYTGCRLYALSSDGYLAVLDPKDGRVLEKSYLNDPAKPGAGLSVSTPQIAAGRLVVGSETGGLQCLIGTEAVE